MTQPAPHGSNVPPVVALYGWLGLIPFIAPSLFGWAIPAVSEIAASVLVAYGALILSFLGGARWGLAIAQMPPNASTISLAMLPSLVALILVATPSLQGPLRLAGLASVLAVHWLWDIGSKDLPEWYPRLRTLLTLGAVAGLLLGAVLLPG
jgi:hypothetical protein